MHKIVIVKCSKVIGHAVDVIRAYPSCRLSRVVLTTCFVETATERNAQTEDLGKCFRVTGNVTHVVERSLNSPFNHEKPVTSCVATVSKKVRESRKNFTEK